MIFFLIFTSFAWEGQNGHFQINLTAKLTDFDRDGNEESVNYSDCSEGSSNILIPVREEVKFLMALRELIHIVIVDVNLGHKPVDARLVQGCTQPSMQRREVPTARPTIRLIRLTERSFL